MGGTCAVIACLQDINLREDNIFLEYCCNRTLTEDFSNKSKSNSIISMLPLSMFAFKFFNGHLILWYFVVFVQSEKHGIRLTLLNAGNF